MQVAVYKLSIGGGKKRKRQRKKLRGVLFLSEEEYRLLERPEFVHAYRRGWGKFFVEKVGEEFTRKKRVDTRRGRRVMLSSALLFGVSKAFGMEEVKSRLEPGWDEWAPKHLTVDLPKMENEVGPQRKLDVGALADGRLGLKRNMERSK